MGNARQHTAKRGERVACQSVLEVLSFRRWGRRCFSSERGLLSEAVLYIFGVAVDTKARPGSLGLIVHDVVLGNVLFAFVDVVLVVVLVVDVFHALIFCEPMRTGYWVIHRSFPSFPATPQGVLRVRP